MDVMTGAVHALQLNPVLISSVAVPLGIVAVIDPDLISVSFDTIGTKLKANCMPFCLFCEVL